MRTTLNIEDDLLERLKREAKRSRSSLTETANRLLRMGMERLHPEPAVERYRCPTFSMGFPPVADLDRALTLAAQLEDDEILRELERGN